MMSLHILTFGSLWLHKLFEMINHNFKVRKKIPSVALCQDLLQGVRGTQSFTFLHMNTSFLLCHPHIHRGNRLFDAVKGKCCIKSALQEILKILKISWQCNVYLRPALYTE